MLKSFLNKIFGINEKVETNRKSTERIIDKRKEDKSILQKNLGFSLFNEERYEEAHKIFKNLNDEISNSENKYLLSITTLKRGETDIAIKLFEQAISTFELDVKNVQHSIPNMKTHFAIQLIEKGNYSLAFRMFKDVSYTYCKYQILDTTFLVMRGIPPFEHYIDNLEKLNGNVDKTEFEKLISKLESKLDKYGKSYIDQVIRKNKNGS